MYVLGPESNIWEKVSIFSFMRGSWQPGLPDLRFGKYHMGILFPRTVSDRRRTLWNEFGVADQGLQAQAAALDG